MENDKKRSKSELCRELYVSNIHTYTHYIFIQMHSNRQYSMNCSGIYIILYYCHLECKENNVVFQIFFLEKKNYPAIMCGISCRHSLERSEPSNPQGIYGKILSINLLSNHLYNMWSNPCVD